MAEKIHAFETASEEFWLYMEDISGFPRSVLRMGMRRISDESASAAASIEECVLYLEVHLARRHGRAFH